MTTIKLKNGSGAPLAGDLVQGEPALDLTNKRLYTENSSGTVIEVGTNPTSVTTGAITSTGIDVTGTVHVQSASSGATASGNADELILEGSGNTGLSILSGATSLGNLFFADSGDAADGFIQYDQSGRSMSFGTATAERMRIDSSGLIQIGNAGSSSSPTIQSLIDPNTGIFFGGADILGFSTGGSERMRIDASGRVGIATVPKSDWVTDAIQLGTNLALSEDANSAYLSANAYNSSTGWKRVNSQLAGYIRMGTNDGIFSFSNAVTGAADSAITWQERMRIDSAGNVGIGRTSIAQPSSGATTLAIQGTDNNKAGAIRLYSANDSVAAYIYPDSTNGLSINTSTSHPMVFRTAGVERMRIDSSGNVGIGTSSPSSLPGFSRVVKLENSSDASYVVSGGVHEADFGISSSGGYLGTATNVPMRFVTNSTESMRIDTSGNLLVGTTSAAGASSCRMASSPTNVSVGVLRVDSTLASDQAYAAASFVKKSNDSTTNQVFIRFGIAQYNSGCGQINANGVSQAAFGANSDRRLKENITDLPSQLENITALRPVEFDYIESEGGGHQIGFIAQEVEEIYPDLVGERHDGMKTLTSINKMEARLIKAIQEQNELINDLRARVAQLESN